MKTEIKNLNRGDKFTIIGKGRKQVFEFWSVYLINGVQKVGFYTESYKIKTSDNLNLKVLINENKS